MISESISQLIANISMIVIILENHSLHVPVLKSMCMYITTTFASNKQKQKQKQKKKKKKAVRT